ncbi:hypothetical protein QBE54_08370 [Thermatribacter velox]|uniref:Uncharacterized protein n=1 Tax=Thermatribacter velox TaxID=3039681 RepID=A0ABZ2Y9A8_9BACT
MSLKVKNNQALYEEGGRSLAVRYESENGEEEKKAPIASGVVF